MTAPRRDLQAKLRAEKKSDKEIQEAIAEATKAGTVKPTPFGTMSYRLYGKKDRIQLLWVLSVPNATPESIGVSEGSQRDEALKGQGGTAASRSAGLEACQGPPGSPEGLRYVQFCNAL